MKKKIMLGREPGDIPPELDISIDSILDSGHQLEEPECEEENYASESSLRTLDYDCLGHLSKRDRELVEQLVLCGGNVRKAARKIGIPHMTYNYKINKIRESLYALLSTKNTLCRDRP